MQKMFEAHVSLTYWDRVAELFLEKSFDEPFIETAPDEAECIEKALRSAVRYADHKTRWYNESQTLSDIGLVKLGCIKLYQFEVGEINEDGCVVKPSSLGCLFQWKRDYPAGLDDYVRQAIDKWNPKPFQVKAYNTGMGWVKAKTPNNRDGRFRTKEEAKADAIALQDSDASWMPNTSRDSRLVSVWQNDKKLFDIPN